MTEGFANPIVGGGGALVYPSIHSPDYVPGVSGWSIDRDGNAEFNSITLPPGTGGATIFAQAATPSAHAAGDLWINTGNANEVLTSTAAGSASWVAQQFGTGAILPGAITAALIAANTITAAQLAAGIVYAGIINGTTVSAATFNGSVFNGSAFTANQAGEFYYSGATPGNSFTVTGMPFSSAASTINLTTVAIGAALVVEVITESTTLQAVSLSSSNATWAQLVAPTVVGSTTCTVFIGQVTAAGADVITIGYSSGAPVTRSSGIEVSAAAGFASISLDTSGTVNAVTDTFPSLTPAAAGEFYFGYALNANIATVGATPGYFYSTDANGNGQCYNPACGAGAQAPVWGDTPADQLNGIAVLLKSAGASTGSHVLTGSNASAAGTDAFGNNYLQGEAAYNNSARTAAAIVGGTATFYTMTPNPGAAFTAVGSIQAEAGPSGSTLALAGTLAGIKLQGGSGGPGLLTTDANGIPVFASANGNAFKAGLQCKAAPNNQLINATGFTAVLALNLDAGNYRIRARAIYQTGATAAGVPTFAFAHGSSAHVNLWTSRAVYYNSLGTGITSQYQHVAGYTADFAGPTMASGTTLVYEIDAYVAVGVAGTVILSAATSVAADTFNILSGSILEAQPV